MKYEQIYAWPIACLKEDANYHILRIFLSLGIDWKNTDLSRILLGLLKAYADDIRIYIDKSNATVNGFFK